MEQDVLNERLMSADHVPIHQPSTSRVEEGKLKSSFGVSDASQAMLRLANKADEDEEEMQLRQLKAELAM